MMKLHEAMVLVLREKGHPMTTRELADEINMRKLYCRHDELPLPSSQIGARAKNYPHLFVKTAERKIGLV